MTPDEHLKLQIGELHMQLAIAKAKIDVLVEELAKRPAPDTPPELPTP